jgi:hypothetical protein
MIPTVRRIVKPIWRTHFHYGQASIDLLGLRNTPSANSAMGFSNLAPHRDILLSSNLTRNMIPTVRRIVEPIRRTHLHHTQVSVDHAVDLVSTPSVNSTTLLDTKFCAGRGRRRRHARSTSYELEAMALERLESSQGIRLNSRRATQEKAGLRAGEMGAAQAALGRPLKSKHHPFLPIDPYIDFKTDLVRRVRSIEIDTGGYSVFISLFPKVCRFRQSNSRAPAVLKRSSLHPTRTF